MKELKLTPLFRQLLDGWRPEEARKALHKAIANALHHELKERGLWYESPQLLGYPEESSWKENSQTFDQLCLDCYIFAIVDRFKALSEAAKRHPNIEGIIFNNIKHFLTERQQKRDPIGYAVAENVRSAIELAIENNILIAEGLKQNKVCNRTLLSFTSEASPKIANQLALKAILSSPLWLEIRFQFIQQCKKAQEKLYQELIALLPQKYSIDHFRFKELAEVMKDDVRQSWHNAHSESDAMVPDETEDDNEELFPELIQWIEPDTTDEDFESWRQRTSEIGQAINEMGAQDRLREGIKKVFDELVVSIENEDEVPSQVELSRRLNIPKPTVHKYLKHIATLIIELKQNNH
jgi:hypothetical protein